MKLEYLIATVIAVVLGVYVMTFLGIQIGSVLERTVKLLVG